MIGNKQAYDAAYQRALEGKSARGFLDLLAAPFEDQYTRTSRERGFRDGQAAREQDDDAPAGAAPAVH